MGAKSGERVAAVVQPHAGRSLSAEEIIAFVKARIGSVKALKQVDVRADLPRSKVGKAPKKEIRAKSSPTRKAIDPRESACRRMDGRLVARSCLRPLDPEEMAPPARAQLCAVEQASIVATQFGQLGEERDPISLINKSVVQ